MQQTTKRTLLLACIFLMSCSSNSVTIIKNKQTTRRLLSFPPAFYNSVVLINDKLIGFTFGEQKEPANRVSFAFEDDRTLHPFNPQKIKECDGFIGYGIKGKLPDGRIGFLGCGESVGSKWSIFALDWQTGKVEQLVNGKLQDGYSPKDFTWNPQMTRGIQEMVDGVQGTIYWLSKDGISPMDIEIEDQGFKWNLKDYYENRYKFTKGTGIAFSPAWSPDGRTIAFFASTYGIRETPRLKENIRYELYFMDPDKLEPVQVLQNITNAYRIRWAFDSKQLIFSGCFGQFESQCGLWLYDLDTKSLLFIDEGDFQDFIWITNDKVVAIRNITLPFDPNQILEYTITRP
jgi:hypothetical protein